MEQTREVRALDQVADLLTECSRLRAELAEARALVKLRPQADIFLRLILDDMPLGVLERLAGEADSRGEERVPVFIQCSLIRTLMEARDMLAAVDEATRGE